MVWAGVQLHPFVCGYSVVAHHFLKRLVCSLLNYFNNLAENELTINVWDWPVMDRFISGLWIRFYWSVFLSLWQCQTLDYCHFVVSFDISVNLSVWVLFFNIVLAILSTSHSHMHCNFCEKVSRDFDTSVLVLLPSYVKSSDPWTWPVFTFI